MATKIISVHSFRGGTGKSNTSANLAAQLAAAGLRVAVVDTDVQSPGIHVLYGFGSDFGGPTLNDFLYGGTAIAKAAHDVTPTGGEGRLWLVPSSMKPTDIARVLRQGYDVELLNDGFRALISDLSLDVLVIDTHPGLNEETLLSITISDTLLLLLRPDKQDYQGTAVTVDVARRLEVPELLLVVNKVPSTANTADLAEEVRVAYDVEVAGVLPLSEDLVTNASGGLFSLTNPEHRWSQELAAIAARLRP